MEKQRLTKLIEKNPTLQGMEPNEILATQLHVDWSKKESNKPVFQYHEPEPLPSPAVRAQKQKAREKQGSSRWLSTQLPEEWGDNDANDSRGGGGGGGGGGGNNFNTQMGREVVTVRTKGSKRIDRFDATPTLGMEPLGPGKYFKRRSANGAL